MRMKKLFIAGLLLCICFTANAQENMKFDSEAEKLKFIRQMLLKEKYLRLSEYSPKHCAGMMKDLLKGKNFKAIEPDVIAYSEDDPRLEKWNQCYNKQPEDFGLEPQQFYMGLQFLGSPPYRYYRIELDGNTKNGTEDMIYHEAMLGKPGDTGYTWVNLKKCEIKKGGFSATGSVSTISPKPNAVYLNTLVYYKGKLWAVDFVDGFDFSLKRWLDRKRMETCRWRLYEPE